MKEIKKKSEREFSSPAHSGRFALDSGINSKKPTCTKLIEFHLLVQEKDQSVRK
jgi:hypothetical protein